MYILPTLSEFGLLRGNRNKKTTRCPICDYDINYEWSVLSNIYSVAVCIVCNNCFIDGYIDSINSSLIGDIIKHFRTMAVQVKIGRFTGQYIQTNLNNARDYKWNWEFNTDDYTSISTDNVFIDNGPLRLDAFTVFENFLECLTGCFVDIQCGKYAVQIYWEDFAVHLYNQVEQIIIDFLDRHINMYLPSSNGIDVNSEAIELYVHDETELAGIVTNICGCIIDSMLSIPTWLLVEAGNRGDAPDTMGDQYD
jgi:hypothetical protein